MKIGILTFHCAHNYGAVLQAYALQTYLQSIGHDACIIDYRPRYLTKPYDIFDYHRFLSRNPAKCVYYTLREIKLISSRFKRHAAFEHFINTRLHLYPYRQPDDLKSFDLILLGSDQIWTKSITGNRYDNLYWGLDVPVPVATYAASARNLGQTAEDKQYISRALAHLTAISLREDTLIPLLAPLTQAPLWHVLDPTLLIDSNAYEPLLRDVNPPRGRYVLVYQVGHHPTLNQTAIAIAKQLNCTVIELAAYANSRKSHGCTMLRTASPETFLAYIRHAACVVTTSFHGTALSTLFRRPFYTVRWGNSIDERAASLLKAIGLENRSLAANEIPQFSEPDFSKAHERLRLMRENSYRYIQEAIALAQNK